MNVARQQIALRLAENFGDLAINEDDGKAKQIVETLLKAICHPSTDMDLTVERQSLKPLVEMIGPWITNNPRFGRRGTGNVQRRCDLELVQSFHQVADLNEIDYKKKHEDLSKTQETLKRKFDELYETYLDLLESSGNDIPDDEEEVEEV